MEGDGTRHPPDPGSIHSYLASFVKDVDVADESIGGRAMGTAGASSGGNGGGGSGGGTSSSFDASPLAGHPGDGSAGHFVIHTLAGVDGQPYLAQNADGRFYQAAYFHDTDAETTASATYGGEGPAISGFGPTTSGRQFVTAAGADGTIVYTTADCSPMVASASPLTLSMAIGSSSGNADGRDTIVVRTAGGRGSARATGPAELQEQPLCVSILQPGGAAATATNTGMSDQRLGCVVAPQPRRTGTATSSSLLLDKASATSLIGGAQKSMQQPLLLAGSMQQQQRQQLLASTSGAEQQQQQQRLLVGGTPVAVSRHQQQMQQRAVAVDRGANQKLASSSAGNPVALLNTGDNNSLAVTIMPSAQSASGDEAVSYVLIVSQPSDGLDAGTVSGGSSGEIAGATDLSMFSFKDNQLRQDQPAISGSSNGTSKQIGDSGAGAEGDEDEEDEDDDGDEEEDDERDLHGCQLGADSNSCSYCDYTSPKRYLLSRHMKTHSEDRPHKCNVCDRAFKTQASLTNHTNTHTGTRPHKCKDCDSAFTTSGELVRHMRYRHTFERPHKCGEPGCDYSSVELSKLKRHVRSHTGERPYQCPHCPYASPDTYKLKRHLRIHTGEKPYECDTCSARFTQSNSLKAHKLIHSGNKPVFQCELCPTTCGRKTDLKIHIQKLHTSDRPLQCKKCSKYFPDRYTYKLHLKSHDGEKCFKCGLCAYAALSERHLQTHILTQHNQEKPYECSECSEAFRYRPLLRRHKIFVHGTEDFRPKDKQFGCGECGKAFVLEDNFQRHQLYHDPEAECYNNDEFLSELEAIDEIGETFDEEDDQLVDEGEAGGLTQKQQHSGEGVLRQLAMPEMPPENVMMRRIVRDVGGHRVVVMEVGPATALLSSPEGAEANREASVVPTSLAAATAMRATGGSCRLSLDYASLARQNAMTAVTGGGSSGSSNELLTDGATVQMMYNIVGAQVDDQHVSQGDGHVVAMHILEDGTTGRVGTASSGCGLGGKGNELSVAGSSAEQVGMLTDVGQTLASDRDCSQLLYVGSSGSSGDDLSMGTEGSCNDVQMQVCRGNRLVGTGSLLVGGSARMSAIVGKRKASGRSPSSSQNKLAMEEDNRDSKTAKLDECFFDEDAL